MEAVLLPITIVGNSEQVVKNSDVRALVTGVLARAIMHEQHVPDKVNISFRDKPIPVTADGGQVAYRTGQLTVNTKTGNNLIQVSTEKRDKDGILNSIYHELTHLIRVLNGSFKQDQSQEEIDNLAEMRSSYPPIGWIASILMADEQGELPSLENYGEEQDTGAGTVVRNRDTSEAIRLSV